MSRWRRNVPNQVQRGDWLCRAGIAMLVVLSIATVACSDSPVKVPASQAVSTPTWEQTVSEASATFETRAIEFAEVEPRAVHERLRVPQTDADFKGALFDDPLGSGVISHMVRWAGSVLDLCVFEEAFFRLNWRFPDVGSGEPTADQRAEVSRFNAGLDCRGPAAHDRPIAGYSLDRWFYVGLDGIMSVFFVTRDQAVAAYQAEVQAVQQRHENTLPLGVEPLGFLISFAHLQDLYGIMYSPADAPVDAVHVLSASVAVSDGALRGLMRNQSRTLWAYGVTVHADNRSWTWPLSVQPGEAVPFEINQWDGPADSALIDFGVTAEMSNDADLSRAYFMFMRSGDYLNPEEFSARLPGEVINSLSPVSSNVQVASAWRTFPSLNPDSTPSGSHPSLSGRLSLGLIDDLRVYMASFDHENRVVDLEVLRPYFTAEYERNIKDEPELVAAAVVARQVPHPDRGSAVDVAFEDPFPDGLMLWIGAADVQ